MIDRLRHYKSNEEGVIHIALIAIIVVVLIVVAAVVVYAWTNMEVLDAGVDPVDAIAVIQVDIKMKDLENDIGGCEARGVTFETSVDKVEIDPWYSGMAWPSGMFGFGFLDNKFDCLLTIRCVGPNDYTEETSQEVTVEVKEFALAWSFDAVNFETMRFYVEQNGDYTLTATITIDAPDEGVEDEQAWSDTKKVTVGGF